MSAPTRADTHLTGLWRGRELDLDATVEHRDGALRFEAAGAPAVRVPLDLLDGFQLTGTRMMLYLAGDDVLEVDLGGDDARAVVRSALDAITLVPELTRSLRSMGATHGEQGAAHDRWFAPLLTVRRAIVGVSDPMRQLALFDVDTVARELARALLELAAQRTGGDGPRTRALEARLEEETEAVRQALARVALAATTLEGSAPDSRLADWRRWVDAVRLLFRQADEAWLAIARVLQQGP